jgi:hypothetical protein
MLRSIFAAIANGLRNAFGYAFSIFTWPFRLFMPRQHASAMPDLAALKERLQPTPAKPSEPAQSTLREHVRDSVVAWGWVNGCINDRQTRPLPSALSHKMQNWLQGLDYRQLVALQNAGPKGIFEHSAGKCVIAGVPPVRQLPAIDVRYPKEASAPDDEETPRLVRKFA